jgi:hypothetical protein
MIGEIATATICGVVILGILITLTMVILIGIGVVVIGVLIMDGDILAAGLVENMVLPVGSLEENPVLPAGSLACTIKGNRRTYISMK